MTPKRAKIGIWEPSGMDIVAQTRRLTQIIGSITNMFNH